MEYGTQVLELLAKINETNPRARNDYDEGTTEIYMNPEPGFQSGPGALQTPIRWHPVC